MLGECPFGVWDSAGTFKNGDTNADWKLSVWVSNRAFRSNRAFDTLLHESSHAFSYLNRNCVAPDWLADLIPGKYPVHSDKGEI